MDSLGHGVPVTELEAMLADLNIDEDADGCIELDGFLEFMRRTMVADLPKAKMGAIRTSFERTAKQTSRTEVPLRRSPAVAATTARRAAARWRPPRRTRWMWSPSSRRLRCSSA